MPVLDDPRLATAADAPALAALIQTAYRGDASRAGWTTEADILDGERIDAAGVLALVEAPGSLLLVLDDGQGPLACCHVADRGDGLAYFGTFAVRPRAQGGGVGRRLLEESERRAVADFAAVAMEMTVISTRSELIDWYGRRGFALTGEERPFPAAIVHRARPGHEDLRFAVLRKELAAPEGS